MYMKRELEAAKYSNGALIETNANLQVEIDIGCVAFLVSLFASLGCLPNFSLAPSLLYVE